MLAHRYQIYKKAWGNDFGDGGDKEKRWIGLAALAKRDRACKFEVFNELVAMRLGQMLGLPIPSGMVVENGGGVYYASCHILAAGGELPEADLERFCHEKRREA